jgi:hypothetical protein
MSRREALTRMITFLRWLSIMLVVMALFFSICLLARDTKMRILPGFTTSGISSAPLLLIGASFLVVQVMLRPRWTELLKNVLLAATFILWGLVQLMTQNDLSKKLSDVVVALYVFDLAWVVLSNVTGKGAIPLDSPSHDSSQETE